MANDPQWRVRAPGSYPCRIEAFGKGGERWVAEVAYPPGFSNKGLAEDAVVAKFRRVVEPHLEPGERDRIVNVVLSLEASTDCGELFTAIGAKSRH